MKNENNFMGCFTYLSDNEYLEPTSNEEINDVLKEVREKTGDDWRIRESSFTKGIWWWKKEYKQYSVFLGIPGRDTNKCIEFQYFNFYFDPNDRYNYVNATVVTTLFYGILTGMQYIENKNK